VARGGAVKLEDAPERLSAAFVASGAGRGAGRLVDAPERLSAALGGT
jgi:hypothetical protein